MNLLCTSFFFFNDTATTEIYTLSLHDALPIFSPNGRDERLGPLAPEAVEVFRRTHDLPSHFILFLGTLDRKSTRLNSSHANISYAVFCLKKKKIYNY